MTQAAIMPEWMLERLAGTADNPGEVELVPDEADAFSLFVMLGTQWRFHPMAGQIGLEYAAIPATAAMAEIPVTPALFRDLRTMEAAALEAFTEGNGA